MTVVFILLVLIGVAIGVALYRRNQVSAGPGVGSLGQAEPPTARRTSVRGLRIADVVAYEGHDCIVERVYRFREGGSRWNEHLLVDGDYARWLTVEDDEGLECVVWERRPEPGLEPGEKSIELGGISYRFDEQGTADYTLEEAAGPGGSGRAEYADYVSGEQRLSFERYDGSGWEISVGTVVSEHAFDIFPGNGEVPV